jgi:small-conductance mechanosensitive channel
MASAELRKRLLFFFILATVITVVLVSLPIAESWLQDRVLPQFNLAITPDGLRKTIDELDKDGVSTGKKIIAPPDKAMPDKMEQTTVSLVTNLLHILKILLWMSLVISGVRLLTYLIFGTAFRNAAQAEAFSLLKTVLSVVIYIVAFFVIFQSQYPDAQLGSLFTGSAILGIVVGLALQDTLGNLFAGIALQADQPFQVGDVVAITNRGSGVVESISWRGVKIRTFQNKILVISNSVLGREMIEVAPRDNLNARIVAFNTVESASPARTAQVVREAIRTAENVSQKIRPVVRIRDFGADGLDWEVKYWLEDYKKYNDTDALVRQNIWYAFHREKIEFAFPVRLVQMVEKPAEPDLVDAANAASEQISRVPIFAPLSDDETSRLARASTTRIYAPGEAIVRKGQEGNSMFVILRGAVMVQIVDAGVVKTVNNLGRNDFFGEMSLLTGQPRSATVVAERETEVLEIRKSAMKLIFQSNPDLVKSVVEIIEERKELLKAEASTETAAEDEKRKGVVGSIRNFFGLR